MTTNPDLLNLTLRAAICASAVIVACACTIQPTVESSAQPLAHTSSASVAESSTTVAPATGTTDKLSARPPTASLEITRMASGIDLHCRLPAPVYPAKARATHQEGTVWVRLRMSANGSPTSVVVSRSSGDVAMDDAAVGAASQMQCRPFGRAVTLTQPMVFRLSR